MEIARHGVRHKEWTLLPPVCRRKKSTDGCGLQHLAGTLNFFIIAGESERFIDEYPLCIASPVEELDLKG